jgi:drug/metabolite transporter (DMT)-like permease
LYGLLVCCAVLSGLGDILIFQWSKSSNGWWLTSGCALWVISLVLMGYLFRISTLPFSVVVTLLVVIHLLVDIAWEVGALRTKSSLWQWIGAALAVGAVVLLQIGEKHPG